MCPRGARSGCSLRGEARSEKAHCSASGVEGEGSNQVAEAPTNQSQPLLTFPMAGGTKEGLYGGWGGVCLRRRGREEGREGGLRGVREGERCGGKGGSVWRSMKRRVVSDDEVRV